MKYKIQVFTENEWQDLDLFSTTELEYNLLINDIGEPGTRKISHSNTYALPDNSLNRKLLGLNKFNLKRLAFSLNNRKLCRVISRGQVDQYALVVNNLSKGTINVNLNDRALDLLATWSKYDFKNLLNNSGFYSRLTASYIAAIDEMKNYVISPTSMPLLSLIASETHPLAYFPNTLNAIGEKFNQLKIEDDPGTPAIDESFEGRVPVDRLNVYQTRPAWNVRALLEIACVGCGYSLDIDSSVDLTALKTSAIVPDGVEANEDPENLLSYREWDNSNYIYNHHYINRSLTAPNPVVLETALQYTGGSVSWDYPSTLERGGTPLTWPTTPSGFASNNFLGKNSLLIPDISGGYVGKLSFNFRMYVQNYDVASTTTETVKVFGVYSSAGAVGYFKEVPTDPDQSTGTAGVLTTHVFSINKSDLEALPAGADKFEGVVVLCKTDVTRSEFYTPTAKLLNPETSETYVDDNVQEIFYNENLEYALNSTPNLTYEAPKAKVKDIISYILGQQGLLIDFDFESKVVYLFSYDTHKAKIAAKQFSDWSKYLLKHEGIEYNTDFGSNYGKLNSIGLKDPFPGNTFEYALSQVSVNKYVATAENYNKGLKDVSAIQVVNADGSHPYFEYTCKGLGLVSYAAVISGLTAIRFSGVEYMTVSAYHLQNYNYSLIPTGVKSWYDIVSLGIKAKAMFLLPPNVAKNFEFKDVIYVDELRSACIVEKIESYVDELTPVEVSMIITNATNGTSIDGAVTSYLITTHPVHGDTWLYYDVYTEEYTVDGAIAEPVGVFNNLSGSGIPFPDSTLRAYEISGVRYMEIRPNGDIYGNFIFGTFDNALFK